MCRRGCATTLCCPHSAWVVNATCLLVILGCWCIMIFGRSITATVQGVVGILVSLETLAGMASGKFWVLRWFALYMICNTAVSVGVGASILAGVDVNCASASNTGTCTQTSIVYALSMALGSSSVGVFAAVNSMLIYYTMRRPPRDMIEAKLAL